MKAYLTIVLAFLVACGTDKAAPTDVLPSVTAAQPTTVPATADKPAEGERGAQGERGAKGDRGEKGDKGDRGDGGAAGAVGKPGSDGKPGTDGAAGIAGDAGAAGRDGIDGAAGHDGANGANGHDGVDGQAGAVGSRGEPGQDGHDGIDGAAGVAGAVGATGAVGAIGATGANGAPGAAGAAGAAGIAGHDALTLKLIDASSAEIGQVLWVEDSTGDFWVVNGTMRLEVARSDGRFPLAYLFYAGPNCTGAVRGMSANGQFANVTENGVTGQPIRMIGRNKGVFAYQSRIFASTSCANVTSTINVSWDVVTPTLAFTYPVSSPEIDNGGI